MTLHRNVFLFAGVGLSLSALLAAAMLAGVDTGLPAALLMRALSVPRLLWERPLYRQAPPICYVLKPIPARCTDRRCKVRAGCIRP